QAMRHQPGRPSLPARARRGPRARTRARRPAPRAYFALPEIAVEGGRTRAMVNPDRAATRGDSRADRGTSPRAHAPPSLSLAVPLAALPLLDECFVAISDQIAPAWVEFDRITTPPRPLGRDHARARAGERVVHNVARLAVVDDRRLVDRDRFL